MDVSCAAGYEGDRTRVNASAKAEAPDPVDVLESEPNLRQVAAGMVDLVFAFGLLGAAAAVLWYVGTLLVRAAGSPLAGVIERRLVARSVARARAADRWIADGDIPRAIAAIRLAFYLRPVASAEIASAVANHHTGLLSRLLALSADGEHGSVRLLSLAKVDRLLTERAALQRRLSAVRSGSTGKRHQFDEDVRRNALELARALDQLAGEVLAANQAR